MKGIYYLLNNEEIVYVGKSLSSMKKRINQHIDEGKSIDLLKEMVSLSKPAQNTIIWLKDNLYWENETGEVKIEMKNFTNSEQQQFQKGFKELKSKNLMRRTKRSHYMMNPNALIPLNYDKAIVLWRSLEILEKKKK